VLYGGAEFSSDTDLAILCDDENLSRLSAAVTELEAGVIAVPPFERRYLEMGLAVHFRCWHPDALRMRVDVMSRMRGVAPFQDLWDRRTTWPVGDKMIDLLSLPDLIAAKKTQRDKDWVMIRRLVEANYFRNRDTPSPEQIAFWLRELRTAELLLSLAQSYPDECAAAVGDRPLLHSAVAGNEVQLDASLREEEARERQADREYWAPLLQTLHELRRTRDSQNTE
jgi:hypothetical protein